MRSYLSLIPISAKLRKRQNHMTLLCIVFAVFLVTGIFLLIYAGLYYYHRHLHEKAAVFPD